MLALPEPLTWKAPYKPCLHLSKSTGHLASSRHGQLQELRSARAGAIAGASSIILGIAAAGRRRVLPGLRRQRQQLSSASSAAASSAATKFQIAAMEGKGLGAVATGHFPAGECLLEEEPLLVLSSMEEASLRSGLASLPQEKQQSFWELSDSFTEGAEKTALGIAKTNWIDFSQEEEEVFGIFPLISRLNHSCLPNVNLNINMEKGVATLYALTEIRPGEELCISYIDLLAPREERQDELRARYRFVCNCPACSLTGDALVRSDQNRSRLNDWPELVERAEPQEGLRLIEETLRLIQEELRGNPLWMSRACADGFQGAQLLGDEELAKRYFREVYRNTVLAEGPPPEEMEQILAELEGHR